MASEHARSPERTSLSNRRRTDWPHDLLANIAHEAGYLPGSKRTALLSDDLRVTFLGTILDGLTDLHPSEHGRVEKAVLQPPLARTDSSMRFVLASSSSPTLPGRPGERPDHQLYSDNLFMFAAPFAPRPHRWTRFATPIVTVKIGEDRPCRLIPALAPDP